MHPLPHVKGVSRPDRWSPYESETRRTQVFAMFRAGDALQLEGLPKLVHQMYARHGLPLAAPLVSPRLNISAGIPGEHMETTLTLSKLSQAALRMCSGSQVCIPSCQPYVDAVMTDVA